jgi:hypothetical protein
MQSTLSRLGLVIYEPNQLLMRTILFLLLVIFLGTSSKAQEKTRITKVQTFTMPIVLTLSQSDIQIQNFQTAASFFKVKHGRVKKALRFITNTKKTQIA